MSKNLYKETIDSIKISDEAIVKALEITKNFEYIKNNKKHTNGKIKTITILAASLAIVCIGYNIFQPHATNNSFTLKAYASEITDDAYITIGSFSRQGGGHSYEINDDVINNITATGYFDFFVNCEGENIETITYTANNCSFILNSEYNGFIDTIPQKSDNSTTSIFNGRSNYSSYTIDYDKQPDPYFYEDSATNQKYYGTQKDLEKAFGEGFDTFAPVILLLSVEIDEEVVVNNEDYAELFQETGAIDKMLYEKINDKSENYTIDITVNYTNGQTECQTIQLGCEKNPDSVNDYKLTAKLI